jgi:integrase
MKMPFDRKTCKTLSIQKKPPEGFVGVGTLADMVDNPESRPYYIWDASKEHPGFGVFVGPSSVTYVVKGRDKARKEFRKFLGKSYELTLPQARKRARAAREQAKGEENAVAKEKARQAILSKTLGGLIDDYAEHYKANYAANHDGAHYKEGTLKDILVAKTRLGKKLCDTTLYELDGEEIKKAFLLKRDGTKLPDGTEVPGTLTAAEQMVKVGYRAVQLLITTLSDTGTAHEEELKVLQRNPFTAAKKLCRKRKVILDQVKKNQKRNPLRSDLGLLGLWLELVWDKRNTPHRGRNPMASDYMFMTLFLGTRMNELTHLMWGDRINGELKAESNWVDPKTWIVELNITKNNNQHTVPLGHFLTRLLKERWANRGEGIYVFPQAKNQPHRKVEHYNDPRGAFNNVAEELAIRVRESEVENQVVFVQRVKHEGGKDYKTKTRTTVERVRLSLHDLRRTFATHGATLDIPFPVLQLLMNHSSSTNTTNLYITLGVEKIREYVQKLEDAMLEGAPNVRAYASHVDLSTTG